MKTPTWRLLPALAFLLSAGSAMAGLVGVELGTSAPPTTLGGFNVTPFTADASAVGSAVSSVGLPANAAPSGSLLFDVALTHLKVGAGGWTTWSNGYTGDVYALDVFLGAGPGGTDRLVVTLPTDTKAFYLYVEPGAFGSINFDVQAASTIPGESAEFLSKSISGTSGAAGYGFYSTGPTDPSLTTITISGTDTWPDGFAVGEFGINAKSGPSVADGGVTVLLLGFPIVLLAALRRRLSRQ